MIPDTRIWEERKIQPVGNGLTDMICAPEDIDAFIDLCSAFGLSIRGFTWWCHVTQGHEPCGMGGPRSKYYDGWFSEIPMDTIVRLAGNEAYRAYFKHTWPADPAYRACFWPGFWLEDGKEDAE